MLSKIFLAKLGEQAVVAFLVGFGGVLAASGASVSKALLVGSLTAGGRSVYGVLVRNVGSSESPSVK